MISSFVAENHREWDVHLPKFRLAVNSAVHSSTKVSPAFLNFGREPRMPENTVSHNAELEIVPYPAEEWEDVMKKLSALRDSVARNVEEASNRQADYFYRNRQAGEKRENGSRKGSQGCGETVAFVPSVH